MAHAATSSLHVTDLWDDAAAGPLDPVERLVYRSRLLGSDRRITNTGGGNTSSKVLEKDPLTGEPVEVLWVKGSGGDLRTATRANFASLVQPRLLALRAIYDAAPVRGPKSPAEDAMVAAYPHCTFNLNPRASSIDTPLHAFLPARHVDHTHPNAVIALAAAERGEALTRQVYGEEVLWTPWLRPGFELGLALRRLAEAHPRARGVVLGKHGLINWADDDRECYRLTLDLIERAARFIERHDRGDGTFGGARHAPVAEDRRRAVLVEVLPWLRGRVSRRRRVIATVHADEATLRFVNSRDAARLAALGTSCPDHFLRTKIRPLLVDWDPHAGTADQLRSALDAGLEGYRRDYAASYERCRRPDSPPMRDANPTVVLVPGLGMIAFGKNKSESRVTAEFYACAVEVMRGAEAIDRYTALPEQEAFDIEYWALEEAKLRRMPPEREFERRVVVVVGAGGGIGRAAAVRLAREGAHVVCADLSGEAAAATAAELAAAHGEGIGVAGTGVSACGPAIGLGADAASRAGARSVVEQATLAYGGVDDVVVTAGLYPTPDADGRVPDEQWARAFGVNVTAAYLVADEAQRVWAAQDLAGALVLTTSVNGVVAKRGSLAYDASKAAANHLVRELAVELAPRVRVNAVAPATVVEGSAMFPRDRVAASLAKYRIPFDPTAPTDDLRAALARFYAERTLTKATISPADQAEAIWFLLSDRSSRTTGHVFPVDGGLADAFLR